MNEFLLSLGIAALPALALGKLLADRVAARAGRALPPRWVAAHAAGAVAAYALAWLVLVKLPLPAVLTGKGLPAWAFAVATEELAKLAAVAVLAAVLAPLAESAADRPAAPVRRAAWDPWARAQPAAWHGPTALASIAAGLLGLCFGALENFALAWGNPALLAIRQSGPLVIHAASAALLGWGVARARRLGRSGPALGALAGALALRLAHDWLFGLALPWALVSWFLVAPALLGLWRWAGDSHAARRPRSEKKPFKLF